MKTMTGLLPWAVAAVVAGGAIWFLYDRNPAAGRWLLAGLLIGHGLVHALYLVPQPAATAGGPTWPFDLGRAWAVSSVGLDPNLARAIATALIAAIIAGFALAGLATLDVLPAAWWPALVGLSAALSIVLLALCFDAQLLVGIALDLALLWLALLANWRPTPV